ncbi:uncharacterized protein LOC34618634 [Cyclospora cayetanensis]|uniref:Uncharacterized protein LOC34618634 n=1 Tax=Cyclospora cayetanensis TaxID=88456 RepID=A0A6P6S0L1_9EIME|nr:uncharacterized protein LOC34618634 [Cyclospora cayetanensis]
MLSCGAVSEGKGGPCVGSLSEATNDVDNHHFEGVEKDAGKHLVFPAASDVEAEGQDEALAALESPDETSCNSEAENSSFSAGDPDVAFFDVVPSCAADWCFHSECSQEPTDPLAGAPPAGSRTDSTRATTQQHMGPASSHSENFPSDQKVILTSSDKLQVGEASQDLSEKAHDTHKGELGLVTAAEPARLVGAALPPTPCEKQRGLSTLSDSLESEAGRIGEAAGGRPDTGAEAIANATERQRGTQVDSVADPAMREYLSAALKRDTFRHLLGSIRGAISQNPHIFGSYKTPSSSPREFPQKPGAGLGPSDNMPSAESVVGARTSTVDDCKRLDVVGSEFLASLPEEKLEEEREADSELIEALLPPEIPVDLAFCRAHPRIAVSWLVHSQVMDMACSSDSRAALKPQSRKTPSTKTKQLRLDPHTEAQLACLVPPRALTDPLSAAGGPLAHVTNPTRETLRLGLGKLVTRMDAEGREALRALTRAWYYAGAFSSQM